MTEDIHTAPARREAQLPGACAVLPIERASWLHCMAGEPERHSCIASAYLLTGRLDTKALEQAVIQLFASSDTLRSRFAGDAGEVFRFVDPAPDSPLTHVDLEQTYPDPQRRTDAAIGLLRDWISRGVSLREYPLLHVRLIRLTAEAHILYLNAHHIIYDVWSQTLVVKLLGAAYSERVGGAPTRSDGATISMVEYIRSLNDPAVRRAQADGLAYWAARYEGYRPPAVNLDASPRRPSSKNSAGTLYAALPPSLALKIAAFAGAERLSTFAVHLGAFALLVHLLTKEEDVTVLLPLANRRRKEHAELIGFLVSTVPFLSCVRAGMSLRQWLHQVQAEITRARMRCDVDMSQLRQGLRSHGEVQDPFHLWFNYWPRVQPSGGFSGLSLEAFAFPPPRHQFMPFDIMFQVVEAHRHTRIDVRFDLDIYSEAFIRTLLDGYVVALTALTGDLDVSVEEAMRVIRTGSACDESPVYYDNERIDAIVRNKVLTAVRGGTVKPDTGLAETSGTTPAPAFAGQEQI